MQNVARYPDDPYDRVWIPRSDPAEWSEISTKEKVQEMANLRVHAPSAVMQTAVAPRNDTNSKSNSGRAIEFSWDAVPSRAYPAPGYIGILYFAELQLLPAGGGGAVRQLEITINGKLWSKVPYRP